MRTLEIREMKIVSGGLDFSKGRQSSNVIDWRGATYQSNYVDANGMCYPLPVPTPAPTRPVQNTTQDGDEG